MARLRGSEDMIGAEEHVRSLRRVRAGFDVALPDVGADRRLELPPRYHEALVWLNGRVADARG